MKKSILLCQVEPHITKNKQSRSNRMTAGGSGGQGEPGLCEKETCPHGPKLQQKETIGKVIMNWDI